MMVNALIHIHGSITGQDPNTFLRIFYLLKNLRQNVLQSPPETQSKYTYQLNSRRAKNSRSSLGTIENHPIR